jgi:putative aminopeptidase FrvX
MDENALGFLRQVVGVASPSGNEAELAQVFRSYVGPFVDEVTTDVLGNVAAVINPDARMKVMLAAHMDEIGFMIHFIDEAGFLHFSSIGGNDSAIANGQRVWIQGRTRVAGVIGSKAMHLQTPGEQAQKTAMKDLWVDIGATSKAQAEEVVAVGHVFTAQGEFHGLLGDRAVGRAFDNKAGVVVVAEALRMLAQGDGLHPDVGIYGVATVQEEIGSRGATTAVFDINPQTALAVDMGQARDVPGMSQAEHGELFSGKGPGIPRGANSNPKVHAMLMEAARREGIPYQVGAAPSTSPTDARVLQISRGGVATCLLEVPLRYMHTPSEVLSLSDIADAARLMAAYCRQVTPDTDFRPQLLK